MQQMNAPERRLIGVPAAADMLGLSKRMVYLLASDGRLRACRIGDRVLIPLDELDRFIIDHMTHASAVRP